MIDSGRINNPRSIEEIDEAEIAPLIEQGKTITVQFFEPLYTDAMLDHINRLCRRFDERFSVRFYGGISDAALVLKVPNVKSLCLNFPVSNLRYIHALKHLRELGLSTYNLDDLDILASDNLLNLRKLSLEGPRPNSVNLEPLKHYHALRSLYLSDQTRGIEALSHLDSLESLSLHAMKKTRLDYINGMTALKSLEIGLGGRKNLDEVEGHGIENLEIIRVRGFEIFANLPEWTGLKSLKIEDQIRLGSLSFGEAQCDLKNLWIFNCKTLGSLKGLASLSGLDSIVLSGTSIDIEDMRRNGLPKSLRRLEVYTGNHKQNQQLRQAIRAMGYETAPDW